MHPLSSLIQDLGYYFHDPVERFIPHNSVDSAQIINQLSLCSQGRGMLEKYFTSSIIFAES